MPTVLLPIRRVRRAPYVTDERTWTFHDRLRLDVEAGIGNTAGSDPQFMLRWSDDGGHVWSNEHWRGAGKIGEYRRRAAWNRLGRSRQRIYETVFDESAQAVLILAELDAQPGMH